MGYEGVDCNTKLANALFEVARQYQRTALWLQTWIDGLKTRRAIFLKGYTATLSIKETLQRLVLMGQ